MGKRIFITGDTHGHHDIRKLNNKHFPQQNTLTKEDFVIVTGDFGLVWRGDNEEKYWLEWLDSKNFTTLFIDGNHEGFNLLNAYPVEEWRGGKIHRINNSVIHLMRGQVFNLQDKSFFTMGGATSVDKAYRKENISWWADETPSYAEFEEGLVNLQRYDNKVDYILTHTAPKQVIKSKFKYDKDLDQNLNEYLTQIWETVEFTGWYFGHFHDDVDFDKFHMVYYKVQELK